MKRRTFLRLFEMFNTIGKCLYFKGKTVKNPNVHNKRPLMNAAMNLQVT
jgi:hypothetical protein